MRGPVLVSIGIGRSLLPPASPGEGRRRGPLARSRRGRLGRPAGRPSKDRPVTFESASTDSSSKHGVPIPTHFLNSSTVSYSSVRASNPATALSSDPAGHHCNTIAKYIDCVWYDGMEDPSW